MGVEKDRSHAISSALGFALVRGIEIPSGEWKEFRGICSDGVFRTGYVLGI